MKEDAYAASGLLGKLLCAIGAHRFCDHPRIEDVPETYPPVLWCPKCEQEFTFNGEKFIPLSPARYCLRGCGHFKTK